MQLTTVLSSLLGAALVAAEPVPAKFGLMALRSASDVHFAPFSAARRSVFLRLPQQNATCESGSTEDATFYLQDGKLFLYTDPAKPQELFADRSGMGQGKFGYITGDESPPRNGELSTFQLDSAGDLTLNGAGFIACPNSIDGAWSIWVDAGVANPAGNDGCLGISVRSVQTDKPNRCEYTS